LLQTKIQKENANAQEKVEVLLQQVLTNAKVEEKKNDTEQEKKAVV